MNSTLISLIILLYNTSTQALVSPLTIWLTVSNLAQLPNSQDTLISCLPNWLGKPRRIWALPCSWTRLEFDSSWKDYTWCSTLLGLKDYQARRWRNHQKNWNVKWEFKGSKVRPRTCPCRRDRHKQAKKTCPCPQVTLHERWKRFCKRTAGAVVKQFLGMLQEERQRCVRFLKWQMKGGFLRWIFFSSCLPFMVKLMMTTKSSSSGV